MNFYDHGFCLNRSLVTDPVSRKEAKPEFTPRKRALFEDDAATMLLMEGSEGDELNSIAVDNFVEQVEHALKRYKGKFVHVAFMDGHVEKLKLREIPNSVSNVEDKDTLFWTGFGSDKYSDYERAGGGSSIRNAYLR